MSDRRAGANEAIVNATRYLQARLGEISELLGINFPVYVLFTKLDRLARSISDLCAIVKRIEAMGASLRILGMGLDTSTASGRLMLNVLGSVAQFEREQNVLADGE